MRARLFGGVLVAWAAGTLLAGVAQAQQLNNRKDASPSTTAKVSRLVTRATLQGAKKGDSLKHDDLSDLAVSNECGAVQVGGTPAGEAQAQPKSLVGVKSGSSAQTTTVVPGSVVNICRR